MQIFLKTDRLLLRRLTESDVDNLCDLDSDPEVMRFLTGGEPTPREEIRDVALPRILSLYEWPGEFGYWGAVERLTGNFLGWFCITPPRSHRADDPAADDGELGYRLRRSAWGKGYATEASRALIRQAFTESGLHRVHAQTMAVNTRSRRVMERAGLTCRRTFHEEFDDPISGAEHGEVEYALTRAEWELQDDANPTPPAQR
ncbi:MAG: GNAT family N-acetyltransferase [Micromonosporaceae bacterium]